MSISKLTPDDVQLLVVHCSATKPSQNIGAKEIDRWHRDRGFVKIGYHFVIRRNGQVEEGRSLDQRGAHAEGFNHNSVGICLVGGLSTEGKPENNFTPKQMEALTDLLLKLTATFPHAEVVGHRDLPGVKKDCPCFDVKAYWSAVSKP